eukprot:CAMPEP_0198324764 /NCGR_PEP_ID=MMETSP1450-20131203/12698_1 /TAXON_ID=753684 ORGANISM="Madagascaria erythrocladiodes, Strain CCMP3234" /NCGR_SAMPLE_ID=MMETSP1450 /ASSEMBLY_ACC=CAM_ASM_001115 /LENGTH=35 /DNA_ID= /DNA_START= /DNA_END= /DNA_ORIENTATION=
MATGPNTPQRGATSARNVAYTDKWATCVMLVGVLA